jgi:hypothetical protein
MSGISHVHLQNGTVQLPLSWRGAIEASATLRLLFDLYAAARGGGGGRCRVVVLLRRLLRRRVRITRGCCCVV